MEAPKRGGHTRSHSPCAEQAPWHHWSHAAVAMFLSLVWAKTVQTVYVNEGPFVWLGVDFRAYYAQALILRSGLTASLYDFATVEQYRALFQPYAHVSWPLDTLIVPYPPIFALLVLPFTWLPPRSGFVLWTLVNLLVALHLARRIVQAGPSGRWWSAGILFLLSFQTGYTLFLGQPMLLLAAAVGECFLALRARRDLAAGLWLGILLIKPQYGLFLGPLLLWKRRGHAVAGVAGTGIAILIGSFVAAGAPGLRAYAMVPFAEQPTDDGAFLSFPQDMINWRMVLLLADRWSESGLSDDTQLLLTIVLGALTAAIVFAAWRGPWSPGDPRFPSRMSLVWLGTVLATYHSHAEGPVLAALPIASALLLDERRRSFAWAVLSAMIVPCLLMLVARSWLAPVVMLQTVALFAAVAWSCRAPRATARPAEPSPA